MQLFLVRFQSRLPVDILETNCIMCCTEILEVLSGSGEIFFMDKNNSTQSNIVAMHSYVKIKR